MMSLAQNFYMRLRQLHFQLQRITIPVFFHGLLLPMCPWVKGSVEIG